jgi:hypothetical protein
MSFVWAGCVAPVWLGDDASMEDSPRGCRADWDSPGNHGNQDNQSNRSNGGSLGIPHPDTSARKASVRCLSPLNKKLIAVIQSTLQNT